MVAYFRLIEAIKSEGENEMQRLLLSDILSTEAIFLIDSVVSTKLYC